MSVSGVDSMLGHFTSDTRYFLEVSDVRWPWPLTFSTENCNTCYSYPRNVRSSHQFCFFSALFSIWHRQCTGQTACWERRVVQPAAPLLWFAVASWSAGRTARCVDMSSCCRLNIYCTACTACYTTNPQQRLSV